jgi:HSP20 family protein
MSGLIPFNTRNSLFNIGGLGNMLDDFFTENWLPSRNLMRDTFKIDVEENEQQFLIHAEVPGVNKEQISLDLNDGRLTIAVNKTEDLNEEKKNYIHRERRVSSMSRSVYLADASLENIGAKLENGVLTVTVPKQVKQVNSTKIEIE